MQMGYIKIVELIIRTQITIIFFITFADEKYHFKICL
jgi:hypothetical protein